MKSLVENYLLTFFVALSLMIATAYAASGMDGSIYASIIIPQTVICILLAVGIAPWLLKSVSIFDPTAIVCLFGISFFLIGPTIQMSSRYYPYITWQRSLDEWTVIWFYLQIPVLFAFAILPRILASARPTQSLGKYGPGKQNLTVRQTLGPLVVTGMFKIATLVYFGGFSGMLQSYQSRLDGGGVIGSNSFGGLGPLVLIGDMFPIAAGIFSIAYWRHEKFFQSRVGFAMFMFVLIGLSLLLVGLRGSRSTVIFSIVVVMILYHFFVRSISRRLFICGLIFLPIFMQSYLTFKFAGIQGVFSESVRARAFAGRNLGQDLGKFVLVRDFGRADVQTIVLQRVFEEDHPLSYGRSLISGVTAIIPSIIFPGRPSTFIKEKTEILTPSRTYRRGSATTLVFGGLGEWIVNFGILGIGIFFVGSIFIASGIKIHLLNVARSDASRFLAPSATLLPIAFLIYDSNSLVYFLIQFCSLPTYFYWRLSRGHHHVVNNTKDQKKLNEVDQ